MFRLNRILHPAVAAVLGAFVLSGVALAEGEDGSQGTYSSRGGSPWATYYRYLEENPEIYAEADRTYPHGMTGYGKNGQTEKKVAGPKIPGKIWPIVTQPYIPQGPEKTMNWAKTMDRITGYSQEPIGSVNLSPGFAALSLGVAGQMLADQLQSPQATMPRAREEQNQQVQLSADNTAAMERQQAGCAIDFVASYLYNFTVEEGNKWNQVRNRLFLPMALLLLLPGAILAQVKSIASQGFAVLGEISPFDGIVRSIIAIFLIPGTYLVVNYGIDVANSITKVVSEEYTKTFGTNMYEDAMCAHIRAFPFREPIENKNFVPNEEAKMTRMSPNNTPFAELEAKMINVKLTDPCAKLNIVPADRANEQVKYSVNAQRNAYNTANAALAMAWNILCAFQMAYLYYLWFVGPVVAALWVYPMKQLRDAFPSWCEGVITICFWSLFWSTVVLLMACFRGVDETGTVVMTALNFLATACVKFAFDFAGLVKDAGREAGRMGHRLAEGAAGRKGAHGAASGQQHGAHSGPHGANGAPGTHGTGSGGGSGVPPSSVPAIEGSELAGAAPAGAFEFEGGAAGLGSVAGGPDSLAANGGGINGHVSMHDFPHPPLAGHHHAHAPGVVGTALGGAALFMGLAAMAQPHFMNHGAGGLAGADPHAPGGGGTDGVGDGTGVAGTGPTSSGDDGREIPVASAEFNDVTVDEGDLYEHNWGEAASLNSPIASASLTADGPPLSSLPVSPAVSLTPDIAAAIGMPPSSNVDGTGTAMNAAPNLVASADGINGAVGVPGVHQPVGEHHVAHNQHHVGGEHHVAHNQHHVGGEHHVAHNQHPVAGEHHVAHNQHHASGDHVAVNQQQEAHHHDLTNLNAMFKDSALNVAAQTNLNSTQAQFNNNPVSAGTDIGYSASWQPQQNYDYTIANTNTSDPAVSPSTYATTGGTSNGTQYVDNSIAPASISNYYDPSSAGFSALASSIAGDSITYVDDGTIASANPGMSTTAAYGDYTTTTYSSDAMPTTYSADAVSTTYSADATPTNIAANVTSLSSSSNSESDSYTNALSAGGFVAPPPDNSAMQLFASNSMNPAPQPQQADIQLSQSQHHTQYHNAAPQEITMNAAVQQTGQPPAPGAIEATVATTAAQAGAGAATVAAAGSVFSAPSNEAAQQLRNRLAYPDGGRQAGVQQPKNVKVTPPGGKQIAHSALPGDGKQSVLGSAVGKAGIRQTQPGTGTPTPKTGQNLAKTAPTVKPSSSVSSLQDSVQAANTRNRYIQPGKLTPEEQAELEARARDSGDWLPSE